MQLVLYIGLPIAGIVLGWTIRWLYARFQLSASEQRAERVKQDAIREAEAQKKEILLEATGEEFNPIHYVNYLKEKYTKLYNI